MNDRYSADDLVGFATRLLGRCGLDDEKAAVTAELLVEADLMGHTTHGLQLCAPYLGTAVFAGAIAMRHWALASALALLVLGAVAAAMLGAMGDLIAISRGSSYRSEIWVVVLDRIAERPWFGHGIEADETVPYSRGLAIHAHQMYLSNQFYGGVVATALLALMLAAAGRAAYRDFRSTGSFVLAALLIFVIVAGLFDFGRLLHTVNWVWLVFWLPIALIAGREVCDKAAGQASPQV